jgi:protein tyrosine/serine phosphatase
MAAAATLLQRSAIMLTNEANVKPMTAIELDNLAKTSVLETITSENLARALISPPFILLASSDEARTEDARAPVACLNFRDACSPERTPELQAKRFYRAGKSAFNSSALSKLGIKNVYDLRSEAERIRDPHENEDVMDGVKVKWFAPRDHISIMEQMQVQNQVNKQSKEDIIAQVAKKRLNGETEEDEEIDVDAVQDAQGNIQPAIQAALVKSYLAILHSHQDIFRQILLDLAYLKDPSSAILLHCTAGKDRTGVAIAMLQSLAGCSDEGIASDYALTRIGVEPAREHLIKAMRAMVPHFATNDPRFLATSESRAEIMLLFLRSVRDQFGNFEGYAKNILGLTAEEVEAVKVNVRV